MNAVNRDNTAWPILFRINDSRGEMARQKSARVPDRGQLSMARWWNDGSTGREKYTWRYCGPSCGSSARLIRVMPGNGWMILMAMKRAGGRIWKEGKLYWLSKRVIRVIRSMTCAKEKFKRGVVCILLEDETRLVLEQNIFPFTVIFEIFINFKSRLRELSNFPK